MTLHFCSGLILSKSYRGGGNYFAAISIEAVLFYIDWYHRNNTYNKAYYKLPE